MICYYTHDYSEKVYLESDYYIENLRTKFSLHILYSQISYSYFVLKKKNPQIM